MASDVVVLGAAGFIGRHVCRALSACGHVVHGLGHGDWGAEERARWGLESWIRADITVAPLLSMLTELNPRAVIHCAGSGSVAGSYASPSLDFERTVVSTADTLEALRQHGDGHIRLVLTSSAAVYGDQGDIDLSEACTRAPVSPYGFHKLAAEHLCESHARFFNAKVSIVRLFSVYGEGLRKQLLWDAMLKASDNRFEFFGTGNERRDWIHVEDAARLLCAAAIATHSNLEVFNGGHVHATTGEVLRALFQHHGSPGGPEFTGAAHSGNPHRLTANCHRAQRHLDWRCQIGLDEGLSRYVSWFKRLQHGDGASR